MRTEIRKQKAERDGRPFFLPSVFWFLTFSVPLCLCGFFTLAICGTDEAQVAAHFRAGQEALKRGELTRATEEFKKVLALDPDLVEARLNLGLVYHALGEYKLAAG